MGSIRSISDLFDVLGGITSVARQLGVGVSTASEIKRRGRIPSEYWRDIIRMAREGGHGAITADLLVDLHARASTATSAAGFAEEEQPFQLPSAVAKADEEKVGAGHFLRFKHLRRARFASLEEVNAHVRALRDEWGRR